MTPDLTALTDILWPNDIPTNIQRDGFIDAAPNNLAASEFDRGLKTRRTHSGRLNDVTLFMRFTPEQYLKFKRFVAVDLNGGTLRFRFRDWDCPAAFVVCGFRPQDGRAFVPEAPGPGGRRRVGMTWAVQR